MKVSFEGLVSSSCIVMLIAAGRGEVAGVDAHMIYFPKQQRSG